MGGKVDGIHPYLSVFIYRIIIIIIMHTKHQLIGELKAKAKKYIYFSSIHTSREVKIEDSLKRASKQKVCSGVARDLPSATLRGRCREHRGDEGDVGICMDIFYAAAANVSHKNWPFSFRC